MSKYIKLEPFNELIRLINKRDSYQDWSDEYEKYDKKVKKSIEWIRSNAKTVDELINQSL